MGDDFNTQDWADHHLRLTTGITAALASFWRVFERHHDRQTAAPWRQPQA